MIANALELEAAENIAIRVELAVGREVMRLEGMNGLSNAYLTHTFTATFPIGDGPKTAQQRREAFLSVLQWKWANLPGMPEKYTKADRDAITAEIREGMSLGRTDRWKASMRTLANQVFFSGDTSFAIMQQSHFAFLRNSQ